jgi:hypothetical protein
MQQETTTEPAKAAIVDLIEKLRVLRGLATPGEWYISDLDGAWAAAVDAPLMKAIGESFGKISGGPEQPIGDCDFSGADEAYALAAANSLPSLLDEIELLRDACSTALKWVENMRIVEGGERARLRDKLRHALGPREAPGTG